MKKLLISILLSHLYCFSLLSQSPGWILDSKSRSLAQITSVQNTLANPAWMSLNKEGMLQVGVANDYFISELSTLHLFTTYSSPWGQWGALCTYDGLSDYQELRLAISVSKLLISRFSLGVRLYYYRMQCFGNEDVINRFAADFGMFYQLVDNLQLGMLLMNPLRTSYSVEQSQYHLPVYMAFGLSYAPTSALTTLIEVAKDLYAPIQVKVALAYRPYTQFEIRLGVLSNPFMPTLGLGLGLRKFTLDLSCSYHTALGYAPSLTFKYYFK